MALTPSCWCTLSPSSTRWVGGSQGVTQGHPGPLSLLSSDLHQLQPCPPIPTLQTLAALPDQDSFYDVTDALEQQGMEALVQRHLGTAGTDVDLRAQLVLYEVGWAIRAGEEGKEGLKGREERRRRYPGPHPIDLSLSHSLLGPTLLERPAVGGWRPRRSRHRWAAHHPPKTFLRGGQEEPPISRSALPGAWVRISYLGPWGGVDQPGVALPPDRPHLQLHRPRLSGHHRRRQPGPAD